MLDRRKSGDTAFNAKFASVESAPVDLDEGVLKLVIVVDHSSVEVFAQDGKVLLTDLVFPDDGSSGNWLDVQDGPATVQKLVISSLA